MNDKAWVGIDLDGTLAHFDKWQGRNHIGEPIPKMIEKVKELFEQGIQVKIFTARVDGLCDTDVYATRGEIEKWCLKHLGQILEVTNQKDMYMLELWDDRARQVKFNTGEFVG